MASALGSGSLKTLKTIQLDVNLDTRDEDPYFHLTKELEAIAGRNTLGQITLNIRVDDTYTTDAMIWAQLDKVLSIPNGFPSLHHVEVNIVVPYCCNPDHANLEFVEEIGVVRDNEFPWLMAAEQIQFTFDVILENMYSG